MILLAVLALVLAAALLVSGRWRRFDGVRGVWLRLSPRVVAFVRSAPGTYTYLFVLLITAWVLQTSSPGIAHGLVLERSTNLEHLARDPVRVLVSSAFWVTHAWEVLPWAVLFTLVLAPVERWIGTARWAVVLTAGHIGATLLTAAGLWLAIRAGAEGAAAARSPDVGVSYGFFAVAGVLTYRLPPGWRIAYVAALAGYVLISAFVEGTFTDAGHALALVIGFACYPLTRNARPGPGAGAVPSPS